MRARGKDGAGATSARGSGTSARGAGAELASILAWRQRASEVEQAWGRKTEDALREVGDSVKEAFRGVEETFNSMKLGRPNWWAAASGPEGQTAMPQWANAPQAPRPAFLKPAQASSAAGTAATPAAVTTEPTATKCAPSTKCAPVTKSAPSTASAATAAPAPARQKPTGPRAALRQRAFGALKASRPVEDDGAMRRHCAALERLVIEIGLSPQAARVALRHLDAWLVDDYGKAEMASAEAAAHAAGEVILHVGDSVRLEGLVKNLDANGKRGRLTAYRADDHRWKVVLTGGELFWVRPKSLRPLDMRRMPLPCEEDACATACTGDGAGAGSSQGQPDRATGTASSFALAAGWARLEARQAAWKEEQEAREIELLEREMTIRKHQEALDMQQHVLGKSRQSFALDQARSLAELEKQKTVDIAGGRECQPMAIGSPPVSPQQSPRSCGSAGVERHQVSDDGSGEEDLGDVPIVDPEDGDNVWDTDWITLASAPRVVAGKPSGGPETFAAFAAAAEAAARHQAEPQPEMQQQQQQQQ
eukprot:CAMPEP_0172793190 /NCGR_PEP_ID=MMETSP1074-20121228/209354_1 /TAXON_ID=2916 /ORGANISM="Ceratium fusus, Strain PA161109" /LENGTH=534 /DNA_ID=CAMNT_0013630265 /DNA_START=26 /DNA_END=1627 /DNA_ORIENTATION=+